MSINSKKSKEVRKSLDLEKIYKLPEAVALVKKSAVAKFDETIEICAMLGIDSSKQNQAVRNVVSLPHGNGKTYRVAVFAKDLKADEAKKAGADIVGSTELVEMIQKGEMPFDRCIATPDMMALVGKVGKLLGPKGLMPNPKLGTVTMDVESAVKNAKSGQIEFKSDKCGIVRAGVGKASFSDTDLIENINAFVDALNKSKPQGLKGVYLKKLVLSSTMGIGVKFTLA